MCNTRGYYTAYAHRLYRLVNMEKINYIKKYSNNNYYSDSFANRSIGIKHKLEARECTNFDENLFYELNMAKQNKS
jgi:hypothetical protein